jgi:aspartyl-tRNA synthetase
MYRTHNCGELHKQHIGTEVILSGWVQKSRDLGGMTFVDLRDRYGITQLVFNMETDPDLCKQARKLGREFVIRAEGQVAERSNKNPQIPTGEIEILVSKLEVLNESRTPPFTIESQTDGGEDVRMKYRYLDLRRQVVRKNLELRHQMAIEIRKYMSEAGFLEVETPVLIKSTPEGARDFVVPSRMSPGEFYALPQSPQTFKQLLMVAGFDKYFQIVKCFRDEDLRADRQPEFTQIDCEMSFVERDDLLNAFEGLAKHLFRAIKGVEIEGAFPKMPYEEAMSRFGSDKPDLRFGMEISELTGLVQGKGFQVFDDAEYVGAISAEKCAGYSRKQIDELTDFVKKPQIGMKGLITAKYQEDGTLKSSVDKFYGEEELKSWAEKTGAAPGDLIMILAGDRELTLKALSELRLEMGKRLGLRDQNTFKPLWVVDFPLLEWDEESQRFHAMHHPFTSPYLEDLELFKTDPGKVRARAYDLVINGVEIGGGSIRIHDEDLQKLMFDNLGFTEEEARKQFGFLMNAFRYGAPPHGGIAFGFDRWVSLFAGLDSIRDVIAFPKNNAGRDVMIDTPSTISEAQLKELYLKVNL